MAHDFSVTNSNSLVWIIGGVHGNEPEGVACVSALLSQLMNEFPFQNFGLRLIPEFNPEGLFTQSRLNSAGVDLNRNLPTKDWSKESFSPKYPPGEKANSEPENQSLVRGLDSSNSRFIFSIHSFEKFMMNVNGDCEEIAEEMRSVNQYPIEKSIGYPTPGCLGTYAGIERGVPTVTYEIERGLDLKSIVDIHCAAIWKGLHRLDLKLKERSH